jgi:hypothetical protein
MTGQDSQSTPVLAFLTVSEGEDGNFFGGLLAVNLNGRPLEFHCTAPVRANRAQQILFGSTLPAFVYGEQISQALLAGMELVPAVVCTDKAPVLAVQPHVTEPVVLVERIGEEKEVMLARETAGEVTAGMSWERGSYRLTIDDRRNQQRAEIEQLVELFEETVELDEPFERIREAIQEAQRSARAA